MISKELETIEEFYDKECWEDEVFLKLIENKNPSLFQRTLTVLNSICQLNGDNSTYNEEELKEIFPITTFFEIYEELYFENQEETDDLIINYYVKDKNHTDKGIEYFIIADGYKLLEE